MEAQKNRILKSSNTSKEGKTAHCIEGSDVQKVIQDDGDIVTLNRCKKVFRQDT